MAYGHTPAVSPVFSSEAQTRLALTVVVARDHSGEKQPTNSHLYFSKLSPQNKLHSLEMSLIDYTHIQNIIMHDLLGCSDWTLLQNAWKHSWAPHWFF